MYKTIIHFAGSEEITVDNFMNVLDSGVILCKLAQFIVKKAVEFDENNKKTSPVNYFLPFTLIFIFIFILLKPHLFLLFAIWQEKFH